MNSSDANQGKGGRYGVGSQAATPSGIMDESDTAGRVGAKDVGGPSGDITGTQFDQNPRTAGQHQSRDMDDLARADDFKGQPRHNESPQHQWAGPEGELAEPLGADTSPVQHPRIAMELDGENYRCPSCGTLVKADSQPGQVWCDAVNQGFD